MKLKSLYLYDSNVTGKGLEDISDYLTDLEELSLVGFHGTANSGEVGNWGFITKLKNLETLDLAYADIADKDLNGLSKLKKLKHFCLDEENENITDKGIEAMYKMNLPDLDFSAPPFRVANQRPKGRAPKGKRWDRLHGRFVDK